MTKARPSKEFPSGSFAHAVANAVMSIICENVPALKGRNLQADITEHYDARREDNFGGRNAASAFAAAFMSKQDQTRISTTNLSSEAIDIFQNRLVVEISREIRQQGKNFNYLNLYIRDPNETRPGWLITAIESVGQETGFNLHELMPYREKIAITIHADGEIFWGTSGYGPATANRHLKDYVGKPKGSVPFVNIKAIQPDTKQAYALDLGHYKPVIVPDDEPQEADIPNHWDHYRVDSISHQIIYREKVIAQQEQYLAEDKGYYSKDTHESYIEQRDFLKSLVAMWKEQGFTGYPYPFIALVPESLVQDLSEEDFHDLDVLRALKNAEGTIIHAVADWEHPIAFTSPHQYKWERDFIDQRLTKGEHGFPFMDVAANLKGYGTIATVFRREGDHFHLISQPFYLSEIATPVQTGVGGENVHLNKGEKLIFTPKQCPIGEYEPGDGDIYRFPKAALPYLRLVEAVTQPFNDEGNNAQHFFGAKLGSYVPDLVRTPPVQIDLKL